MRLAVLVMMGLQLMLTGCVSFSSSDPSPPRNTTVVVPPGTAVICADGTSPPCR
ncbi:MAG: hypothetical protein AB7O80_12000 [Acetobacteraceae bacterium]